MSTSNIFYTKNFCSRLYSTELEFYSQKWQIRFLRHKVDIFQRVVGHFKCKFQGAGDTLFQYQKSRNHVVSKYIGRMFFCFVTKQACDWQTDVWTELRSQILRKKDKPKSNQQLAANILSLILNMNWRLGKCNRNNHNINICKNAIYK